jgi:hypothetical protein
VGFADTFTGSGTHTAARITWAHRLRRGRQALGDALDLQRFGRCEHGDASKRCLEARCTSEARRQDLERLVRGRGVPEHVFRGDAR